jgi:hypothetical protein
VKLFRRNHSIRISSRSHKLHYTVDNFVVGLLIKAEKQDNHLLSLMKTLAPFVITMLLLSACTNGDKSISQQLTTEFDASTSAPINLAKLGPPNWDKVCVLGPYIPNKETEKVLGFKWDVEQKSSIAQNDNINLLVFVKGQEVLAYSEHPRNKGDFSKLQSRCLLRKQSTLLRKSDPDGVIQFTAQ